ncbi:GNAT family N-acetyltransferase [Salipiger manganoxidans]|uniref:GNAT family N-acetyltransferase n=1 Tax=Salipiger marinus TaxID=555512 RepID=UPI001E46B7AC|nr:GNAT family N-acetyltransferase [Salipiger manganoxidans]MCD1620040.1 GNAT family N-acetyltransferase [Salipiger manganoxidans]
MQVAQGARPDLAALVTAVFSASEGAAEGAVVGGLVRDLLATTPAADIRVFCATEAGETLGGVIFTRLDFPEDPHRVLLLSPMAVATAMQGQGVGLALLRHALAALRAEGWDVALTYGDPAFYGRSGFARITEAQARAPLPLSMPQGWLGRSLDAGAMPVLRGQSRCVAALDRAELW